MLTGRKNIHLQCTLVAEGVELKKKLKRPLFPENNKVTNVHN